MNHGDVLKGRYELLGVIGQGGMAEVWKAHDRLEDRIVAVKFMRSEDFLKNVSDYDLAAERMDGRFRREASLLSSLPHPSIVGYLDHGDHGPYPYIVMEFVSGRSLKDVAARILPLSASAAVITQIAEALAYIGTVPIVHRDIKPDNIIINPAGRAVLIDFGISLPLTPDTTRYTQQGVTLGSLGYMAPEQFNGYTVVTPKADVYALGCVYYLLLAGVPPFPIEGAEASMLEERHRTAAPALPSVAAGHDIPVAIEQLVMRMLSKDPEARPTPEEVIDAIRGFLPQPGDPPPNPSIDPDPTLTFREPLDPGLESAAPPPAAPAPRPVSQWLSRRDVRAQLEAARAEVAAPEPGAAVQYLAEVVLKAQGQWGMSDPLVLDAILVVADHQRGLGNYGRARRLYEDYLTGHPLDLRNPDAGSLEAHLGIGESHIKYNRFEPAVDAIRMITNHLSRLDQAAAARLVKRALVVARDLDEYRCTQAAALLEELGAWKPDPRT